MQSRPQCGQKWKHLQTGNIYRIIKLATRHNKDVQEYVVCCLDNNKWICQQKNQWFILPICDFQGFDEQGICCFILYRQAWKYAEPEGLCLYVFIFLFMACFRLWYGLLGAVVISFYVELLFQLLH